jgi:hypothetical protein
MKTPMPDHKKAAIAIGKECLKAQLTAENPQLAADKLRTQFAEHWATSRQAYVKLGNTILRKLERAGYTLTPTGESAQRAPAKGKA